MRSPPDSLSGVAELPEHCAVGEGRYVNVTFGIKDRSFETLRLFRFCSLWNGDAPEIVLHGRSR